MAQLAIWFACCLVVAWLTRARPMLGVAAVVILWTCVPAVSGHLLTGLGRNAIGFHPATWLIVAIAVVQALVASRELGAAIARHVIAALSLSVFIVGATVTSVMAGSGGTRLLADQVVGPVLIFLVVVARGRDEPNLKFLRNVVLGAVVAQCLFALVQSVAGEVLLYSGDYETLYWFNPERFDRWMGTTDSPLVLSLAICVAAPLTVSLRSNAVRLVLLALFMAGVIITQSRTGAVTMGILLLYIVLRSPMTALARLLYSLMMVTAVYLILTSTLALGLTSRLANDSGSVEARGEAITFFLQHVESYLVVGGGLTSNYALTQDAGLLSSLESSYMMYAVDVGLVLATLYFGAQLMLIMRSVHGRLAGVGAAALIGFLTQHMFSAVAWSNMTGMLLWLVTGMAVAARPASKEDPAPARRGDARIVSPQRVTAT